MNVQLADQNFVSAVIGAIQNVTGSQPQALHEPRFDGNEKEYLLDCITTGYVSSVGPYVDLFESKLAEITGARHAIAVVNGTAALHICLLLAGVGTGDEVLIPAMSFIATANAVTYCGATAHFIDSQESDLGINVQKLDEYLTRISYKRNGLVINKLTGSIIRAIVPMHCFGHPSNLTDIENLAKKYNLVLIEDAAESLGSTFRGKHTGTFGALGAISFNGNKIVTTGGGGAILTDSDDLASRAKHLTKTARVAHAWDFIHDEVGFNYRMPNINAALGCAQIENLDFEVESKRSLAAKYRRAFEKIEGLSFVTEPDNCKSNYWLQTIILNKDFSKYKEEILRASNQIGISTRPVWKLLNSLPPYLKNPSMDLSGSASLERRIINLPSSAKLDGGKKNA